MKVIPNDVPGLYRTGTIRNITVREINAKLGFTPNILDEDPHKVINSWGFIADDLECGIWDYYGSHLRDTFSTYGPSSVFIELFGDKYEAN